MKRQEVRCGEDFLARLRAVDAELAEPLLRDERVEGEDAHPEADRLAGDLLADLAEAEDAERLVRELDSAPLRALPLAFFQGSVGLRNVAGERDEKADRVLRRRDDVRLGRVRDDDSVARRSLDVDVVDAD